MAYEFKLSWGKLPLQEFTMVMDLSELRENSNMHSVLFMGENGVLLKVDKCHDGSSNHKFYLRLPPPPIRRGCETFYFAFSHWSLCTGAWGPSRVWALYIDLTSLGLCVQIFVRPVLQWPRCCLFLVFPFPGIVSILRNLSFKVCTHVLIFMLGKTLPLEHS